MSDDKFLGSACRLVPRRLFVLLVALALWVYGVFGICWAVYKQQLPGDQGASAWQAQDRCIGRSCQDVLTCRGTKLASFHLRELTSLIGSIFAGWWGFLGALHGYIDDLKIFAAGMHAFVALLAVVAFMDGAYCLICSEYPLNVIDEALMWHVPHMPVREAVKFELRDAMASYPVAFVNQLAQRNVFLFYLAIELVIGAFFVYVGIQAQVLAHLMGHGQLGLGAVYDMRDWKERVSLQRAGYDQYGYRTV
mmetsp:Transcript_61735/g.179076  ORF Transcript_61735/g.179076 Transcript_61735/m.179076 type:complete len:250 (+) Transcript_61735:130-879(+)